MTCAICHAWGFNGFCRVRRTVTEPGFHCSEFWRDPQRPDPPPEEPRARSTDPLTSHEAAASVRRIRESQQAILDVIVAAGPITDEAIFARLTVKLSPSGARTRRAELVERGLVVDSGETAILPSGRRSIKWRSI